MDMGFNEPLASLDEASILGSNMWTDDPHDPSVDPRHNTHTLEYSVLGISAYFPSVESLKQLKLLPGHSAVYDPTDHALLVFPTRRGGEDEFLTVAEKDVTVPLTDDNVTIYSISGGRLVVASLAEAEPSADPELAASMVSKNTITHCKGVEAHRMEVWKQKQKETEGSLAQSAGGTGDQRSLELKRRREQEEGPLFSEKRTRC